MTKHRAMAVAVALTMGACSSAPVRTDAATTHPDTGVTVDSGGGPTDTGNTPQNDTGMTTGTDAGTCQAPSTLHPPRAGSTANLYCPHGAAPDGGRSLYCTAATQHCCEAAGAGGVGVCNATATPCAATTDTDWHCQDPVGDCTGGQRCCGTGMIVLGATGCTNYATGFHGSRCAASCATGEIQMCTSDAQCPTGQHCTPFRTHGAQVGGCM